MTFLRFRLLLVGALLLEGLALPLGLLPQHPLLLLLLGLALQIVRVHLHPHRRLELDLIVVHEVAV